MTPTIPPHVLEAIGSWAKTEANRMAILGILADKIVDPAVRNATNSQLLGMVELLLINNTTLNDVRDLVMGHLSAQHMTPVHQVPGPLVGTPSKANPHSPYKKVKPKWWLKVITSVDTSVHHAYGLKGKLIKPDAVANLPDGALMVYCFLLPKGIKYYHALRKGGGQVFVNSENNVSFDNITPIIGTDNYIDLRDILLRHGVPIK